MGQLGRRTGVRGCCALVCICLYTLGGTATAGTYTFTNVIDNSGSFSGIGLLPTINNAGTAVFFGTGGLGDGIFAGSGGPLTTIASSLTHPGIGFDTSSAYGFRINDSGRAAFIGRLAGDETRVFSGAGGPLTPVAGPPLYNIFNGIPDINNSGAVAFGAFSATPGIGGGVFTSDGGAVTKIAPNSGPLSIGSTFSINNSGQVAFDAADPNGDRALYRGDAVSFTVMADRTMAPFGPGSNFGVPQINDAGVVVFTASISVSPPRSGIYTSDGQTITTVIEDSPTFGGFAEYAVAVNNVGGVAFRGSTTGSSNWSIYSGPDTLADRVVGAGDALFGGTVSFVDITQGAFNDSGQIAFHYELSDGTRGVGIATPIPEPAAGALALCGAFGASSARSRRRPGRLPMTFTSPLGTVVSSP